MTGEADALNLLDDLLAKDPYDFGLVGSWPEEVNPETTSLVSDGV